MRGNERWGLTRQQVAALGRIDLRQALSGCPFERIHREGLNLKIDADNLRTARLRAETSALAQFREPEMGSAAQVKTHCNQDAVDLYARLPFKFEEHAHGSGIVGAAAQHPTAATENGPGQGLHQSARLLHRDSPHLHGPGNRRLMHPIAEWNMLSHVPVIGPMRWSMMHVQESDDACPALAH
jgi:hypothetical protein